MVRPERRVVLAGASPVRVSAGAPGSRLQLGGEIRPRRAECQKPLKEREANRRAATISERNSLVKSSAERCLEGRAGRFAAKAMPASWSGTGAWTSAGSQAAAYAGSRAMRNTRDPTRQPSRAKTGRIRAKSRGAGRESEGPVITEEGAQDNALEGRSLALIMLVRR